MKKEEEYSDNKSSRSGESYKEKDRDSFRLKSYIEDIHSKRCHHMKSNQPPQLRPTEEVKTEGKLNAKELQHAFKYYQGRSFSDHVCRLIVRIFDLDKNGGIDLKEFEHMFFCIKDWVTVFNLCDKNRNGYLTEKELDLALKHMHINFTPEFITYLIEKFDPKNKKMPLDRFIVACVQMQKFSDEFRARDETADGIIKLRYEDFLELVMKNI